MKLNKADTHFVQQIAFSHDLTLNEALHVIVEHARESMKSPEMHSRVLPPIQGIRAVFHGSTGLLYLCLSDILHILAPSGSKLNVSNIANTRYLQSHTMIAPHPECGPKRKAWFVDLAGMSIVQNRYQANDTELPYTQAGNIERLLSENPDLKIERLAECLTSMN